MLNTLYKVLCEDCTHPNSAVALVGTILFLFTQSGMSLQKKTSDFVLRWWEP